MKKMILLLAVSFSVFATQSCSNEKKKEDDKVLSTTNVPASVKDAFNAKYTAASDVTWEDAHENNQQTYKAKFTLNGKKMKAEFDANGTFIKEEEDN